MSLGRKKETTKSTTTTTPTNPAWVTNPMQGYTDRVNQLTNQNAAALVPGASGLQQQAFAGAANLGQPQFSWMSAMGQGQPSPGPASDPGAPQVNGGPGDFLTPKGGYAPQTNPGPNGMSGVKGDSYAPQINGGPGDGWSGEQTGNMGDGTLQGLPGMGGMGAYDLAGLLGLTAATAGANTAGPAAQAGAYGYGASGPASVAGYGATGYGASGPAAANGYGASGPAAAYQHASQGYGAQQAQGQGYDPRGYDAVMGSAQGYDGTGYDMAGPAGGQGYSAVLGQGSGYQASLLDPSMLQMDRAEIGPMAMAAASGFTEAGLNARLNPYLDQVEGAFTADFDANAGRTRAGQATQAAFNGGARNSNIAIQAALTEGELSRARGAGVAGIRSDGFKTAADILGQDNDRATQASIANAGFANQGTLAQFGADVDRNSLLTQLGFTGARANQDALNTAGAFNASAQNQFGLAGMDALNNASQFNASALNQSGLDYASRFDAAGRFGADASNQANQFSAAAFNQQGLANQAASNDAGRFNADAFNSAGAFNSDLSARLSQFNAGEANAASRFTSDAYNQAQSQFADAQNRSALDFAGRFDQAGAFGADAANRSALDYVSRFDQAGAFGANAANEANRFGADALNRSALDYSGRLDQAGAFGAGARNSASQFNASARNSMSQFNASQEDNALARMLQGAGLMGDLGTAMGANDRANIGLQSQLGNDQREIERQRLAANLDLLARQGQLYGNVPWELFNGSTTTGNTQTTQTGFSIDLMRALQAGASLMNPASAAASSGISDPRMKQNVQPMGQGPSGDNLYSFNYIDQPPGAPPYIGPMADEVAMTNPGAVQANGQGPMAVNYNALGVPSPSQQDAMRSLAPDNDPLAWDRMTPDQNQIGQQMNQQRMAQARAAMPARRRGLFGGGRS